MVLEIKIKYQVSEILNRSSMNFYGLEQRTNVGPATPDRLSAYVPS